MDTQGHEPAVLRGLARTIEKHRPVVIFEYDPRFGPQVNDSVTGPAPWLRARGYDCAVPTPGKAFGLCTVCNALWYGIVAQPSAQRVHANCIVRVGSDSMLFSTPAHPPQHARRDNVESLQATTASFAACTPAWAEDTQDVQEGAALVCFYEKEAKQG